MESKIFSASSGAFVSGVETGGAEEGSSALTFKILISVSSASAECLLTLIEDSSRLISSRV